MRQLAASCAAVLLLTGISADARQDPQQPAATFKTAIDLVPVDVNIIDRTGRPVTGLEASDFTLLVDGKPRKVASAEYIPSTRDVDTSARPTYYSSNASSAGGRLIMIVIDQGNIGLGRGKLAMDAVSRFIGTLGPGDRVGLVAIPGAGPQIDFTSNHQVVRTLLPRLVGMAAAIEGEHRVGISEAMHIHDGDQITMNEVVDRECAGMRTAAELELCKNQVADWANNVYTESRDRTRNSVTALRYLIDRMALTPSPKTIVFVSEGLVIERDLSEVSWLGASAAKAQAVIYVMQLDAPQFDAAGPRVSASRSADLNLGEDGLNYIAGLTRGTVMRIISNPDSAFARLGLEISGYYLLSFAPEPGDRDGKAHKIKVEVPGRKGVEIRARSQFAIEAARTLTDEQSIASTLRAPLVANDIALKATTYTLRDAASGKLRVLMAAEIDRTLSPTGRMSLGFTLVDARGSLVASQFMPEVKTPIATGSRTQTFTGSALADSPGVYTLKIAVVDESGRRGSVEHTFRAQLTSAGQIRATDLLIAENTGAVAAGGLSPAVAAEFSADTLHAYVELYSDSAEALNSASVVMEVAEDADGRSLDGTAAQIQVPDRTPNRRTAEAAVPIALLPPGDYVARAVISIDGRRSGVVTRPFRIARARPNVTAPGAGAGTVSRNRAPIPFTSRIDAFDRSSVLTPQVVGFFLDRMNVGRSGASAATPAIDEARAGRFDEAIAALKTAGNDELAAAFLGGLALYAKGDLEAAAGKFRQSLRIDSEFFPAAFYLGSCYAAGGRDREAVGAWQTSLVTESDAPFIYTLLGDALLRLRDIDPAVDILKEATTIWPDNEQVQLRYGTALSLAGRRSDAMLALEPYLARHPEDHERHFIALRTLYEARAEGTAIKSPDEDRAMFARYYAAYVAAKGPQLAMVEQWKKFVEKK